MRKGQGRKPKLNNRELRSLRRHCIKNRHSSALLGMPVPADVGCQPGGRTVPGLVRGGLGVLGALCLRVGVTAGPGGLGSWLVCRREHGLVHALGPGSGVGVFDASVPPQGGGGLWVSGPRARSALVWSTAGGACGLAATALWGVYTVAVGGHTFGLSSALFWVEAAVVPAVVLLGVPCPGGPPDVWGPDLFHACFMPCGMGLLFPTHTIKHLHGGTL